MDGSIDWKVFAAALTIVFGILGLLWSMFQSHRAEVFKKMLEQSEQSREFDISIVRDYARTESLRHMFDSALEPLKVDLRHIKDDLDRFKERETQREMRRV